MNESASHSGSAPHDDTYFVIEITRRCNLRCPHCFTASGGNGHPGPPEAALRTLITDLAHAGIRRLAFSGGEPLLRGDLPSLIRHAKDLGFAYVSVVSNGFLVDDKRSRELGLAGLDGVQISVDGLDATDHVAVRNCDRRDYYRALRAIRFFLDLGMHVDVATILSRRNLERAPEMAMFCEALGVRALRYCTFVPTGRASLPEIRQSFDLAPREIDGFLAFLRTMNQARGARLMVWIDHAMGPWLPSGDFRCGAGKDIAYLSAEGHLYPCPSLVHDAFRVGNAFETPVADLLALDAMKAVRTLPRGQLEGPCSTCGHLACSGGCRGAAYARSGNVRGAVAYCNVASTPRPSGLAVSSNSAVMRSK